MMESMNFSLTKDQISFRRKCREFAESEIHPLRSRLAQEEVSRVELFRKLAREGYLLMCVPPSNGGLCTDTISYALAIAEIAKIDAGVAVAVSVANMTLEAVSKYARKDSKKRILSSYSNGEKALASFALTEKDAGSNPKDIQTRANLCSNQKDTYLLQGEKTFIGNADIAELCLVFAKTGTGREEGISAFLVEKEDGNWAVTHKEEKLGLSSITLVTLSFNGCPIPLDRRLGEEKQGLKIALETLDSGRLGVAAQAIGIAEAAFEQAVSFGKKRKQFGQAIAEHQANAFKLADMKVKLEAAKLLLFRACWLKDSEQPFVTEAAEAKLYASEACNEIVDAALQLHGGYGYTKAYPVERYFRDARATTIYEGTSEIQRMVIARHILNKGRWTPE